MTITDADIIAAIRQEPDRGFRMLVAQYSRRIYWHIRRMVHSHQDAEDITQDTFVRIFRSIGRLESETALQSWIYRIATNEGLRFLERQCAESLSLDDAGELPTADGYIDYSDLEAIRLKQAIQTLPPKQRAAFNLRYYDELGYDEIARILDTTAHSVRTNFHNAKKRIIKYMNDTN